VRVAVIGTGYVGLVSGACLAEVGHDVRCVDVDAAKVDQINRALPPFHEAGLPSLLERHVGRRLTATTDLPAAVRDSELTMIAVGTPFDGREIDLASVRAAAGEIGAALRDKASYHVVVVKSTVVPGTTDGVVRTILEQRSGKRAGDGFGLAMNPEFLTEGRAVADFSHPDRLVLGGIDRASIAALDALYTAFPDTPKIRTNCRTAEMIKYTSNAMLATAISFANEIAGLCEAIGDIDVVDVMRGLHLGEYLRPYADRPGFVQAPLAAFFEAGCGFGGSCLPKDVKALVSHAERTGTRMPLLGAVLETNRHQPHRVRALLRAHFPSLEGVRVAVLGLAFKPDTDDVRESPAFPVIRDLLEDRARVTAYDPVAMDASRRVLGDAAITYASSLEDCIHGAQAVVLVTRWGEFQRLPELLAGRADQPLVVDGRRVFDPTRIARYEGIGWRRAPVDREE
jgi:UDPglucose 6-dehydrogenase